MNITAIRSDRIYREMMNAAPAEKENIYRDELMKPFAFKWSCVGIPLRAEMEGGYDVVSAAAMSGYYAPAQITAQRQAEIDKISNEAFWADCENSIRNTLSGFEQHGIRLPVALAHETNHNVRWQFMQWSSQITLADMIVSEGLAETFAAAMFGEDKVGKWVRETTSEVLRETVKPLVRANLMTSDFQTLSSYLYGDEIMALRGGQPIGMPYCGGYACGYALIGHYLKKTGVSVYEATVTPTEEILKQTEDFWQ